jgi:hypothetical protein
MAPQVSAQRVLLNVYEKIIAGEIITFDALVDEVTRSGMDAREQGPVISRAYRLLKRLNWGLFPSSIPRTSSISGSSWLSPIHGTRGRATSSGA